MVSCVVINYNGKKFLKWCLESLQGLDFEDKELIVIDNASTDDSVDFLRVEFPHIRVVANSTNSGYAGAANQAVKITSGEAVMLLNPDIIFERDYLSRVVARMHGDARIGAIIGKLRRFDWEMGTKTDIIDSAGLVMHTNRRCVDRGQGSIDIGQFDAPEEVFGITGAAPLYRRAALEDAKIFDEYFDNDFFMYKEDVDISWRLRLFGWKCFYEPSAVAYHVRGTGAVARNTLMQVARERRGLSQFQKHHSYRNERLMRLKNEQWPMPLSHIVAVLLKEFAMTGWMFVREPHLFKALAEFFQKAPQAWRKRKEIMRGIKTSPVAMRKWLTGP